MNPSTALPSGPERLSSFGSVDWLSQSSCTRPTHTSRPAEVSWGNPSGPGQASSTRDPPQTIVMKEATSSAMSSDLPMREKPLAGLSKEPDPWRVPRVRTAFSAEQLRALEGVFQHHQYLSPLERKKLAKEMQLSEVQIKTWFQNRRMKHKRQIQDSQLNVPFSGPLLSPVPFAPSAALSTGLQQPCPWASLPLPGPALVLPTSSFWGFCQVEQDLLGLAWASCCQQPLVCHLPDSGRHVHMLGPALSMGP
uniref:VENT homeobox n=1 Tax=Otolemur garnettii TaxID=30611 RepID=H0Y1B0_OTOGA